MKIQFEIRQKDGVYTLVATAYAAPHEQAGFGIEPTPEAQSVGGLKAHLKVTEEIKEKMKALLLRRKGGRMKIQFEIRQKDGVYTLVATAYAAPHEQAGFGIEPTPEAQSVGEVTYRLKAHLKVTEEIKEKMKALLEASL